MPKNRWIRLDEEKTQTEWVKSGRAAAGSGRDTWLNFIGDKHTDILVKVISDLEEYPFLLTVGKALQIMGVSQVGFHAFIFRHQIFVVKDPMQDHPVRGYTPASRKMIYYDPRDLLDVLRGKLNDIGDDRAQTIPYIYGHGGRYAPPSEGKYCNNSQRDRWTQEQLSSRIIELESMGQWITPKELSTILRVGLLAMRKWRDRYDVTQDGEKYPVYIQEPGIVPSSAKYPDTGVVRPGAIRGRGPNFRVLYNRDMTIAWLKGLLNKKTRV